MKEGILHVILNELYEGHVWFTTIPFKLLSDQWLHRYFGFVTWKFNVQCTWVYSVRECTVYVSVKIRECTVPSKPQVSHNTKLLYNWRRHTCSDKGLKVTMLNRINESTNGGSFKITFTVSLNIISEVKWMIQECVCL